MADRKPGHTVKIKCDQTFRKASVTIDGKKVERLRRITIDSACDFVTMVGLEFLPNEVEIELEDVMVGPEFVADFYIQSANRKRECDAHEEAAALFKALRAIASESSEGRIKEMAHWAM